MELTIQLPDGEAQLGVTGLAERNLKLIRDALGVRLVAREGALRVSGEARPVEQAAAVIERLSEASQRKQPLSTQQLIETIARVGQTSQRAMSGDASEHTRISGGLDVYAGQRRIQASSDGQAAYIHALQKYDMVFCTGPAGSGKTYLAVASAVDRLKRGMVRKIVLCRPAVEAGERLGFLPGSLQEKVDPYLRPLLDALNDMMDYEQIQRFIAADVIELIPLAFMRGRTLNEATIILDEAQNATKSQMLMFLTRMGHDSNIIVTGDTSQTDLPDKGDSGLVDAVHKLRYVKGIGMVSLSAQDIVRHDLVQRVVDAYSGPKQTK